MLSHLQAMREPMKSSTNWRSAKGNRSPPSTSFFLSTTQIFFLFLPLCISFPRPHFACPSSLYLPFCPFPPFLQSPFFSFLPSILSQTPFTFCLFSFVFLSLFFSHVAMARSQCRNSEKFKSLNPSFLLIDLGRKRKALKNLAQSASFRTLAVFCPTRLSMLGNWYCG